MGCIELRKKVTKQVKRAMIVRPRLLARVCDNCGKVFDIAKGGKASLSGTFDNWSVIDPRTGKGMGNMFTATACSFNCAGALVNGAWQKLKEYEPYVKAGAKLNQASFKLTGAVIEEAQLIKDWEQISEEVDLESGTGVFLGAPSHATRFGPPLLTVALLTCSKCSLSLPVAVREGQEYSLFNCPVCDKATMHTRVEGHDE